MPSTYTLISSNVLSSSAASVTFSAIPSTYTDLVLRMSARCDYAFIFDGLLMRLNADSGSNYSYTILRGSGSAASSSAGTSQTTSRVGYVVGSTSTANTFNTGEIYIPSYLSSAKKPISTYAAQEDNASAAYMEANANLWQGTSAVTSITLTTANAANFVSTSSFYLYGIKNS
jgi:hypothetical protein